MRKRAQNGPNHSTRSPVVDSDIDAAEVAECFVNLVGHALKNGIPMWALQAILPFQRGNRHRHSKLKSHIESRQSLAAAQIRFYVRHVVQTEVASLDEFHEFGKSPL